MELNLKRALKLRRSLEAHLKSVSLPLVVSIPVLSSSANEPTKVIAEAQEKMIAELGVELLLTDILSKLRTDILKTNVSSGIEDFLAQIASIDRQITVHKTISEVSGYTPDEAVVIKEIEIARKAIETPDTGRSLYGRSSDNRNVSVGLVSEDMVAKSRKTIAELRRRREDIDDQRTAANAKVRIEIAEDHASLLTELGLI